MPNTITIAADTTIDGSEQDVTISGNDAVQVLTVNPGVTLTLNRLSIAHGYADGDAGGIYSERGTVIVLNSADYGGGLANRYGGAMAVINRTVQGGGIHNKSDSMVTLKNTIVANSSTGGNCTDAITDGGGNLSYPDTTCPGINADPLLGPLQDNGGPTWTTALGPGSAAIDAADDAICAADPVNNLDQRGVIRPRAGWRR
jgi:hypothetical protein